MKRLTTLILTALIAIGIFMPVALSLSPSGVSVQAQTVSAADTTADTAIKAQNPGCGFGILGGTSSMGGCIESILYVIPYTLGGMLLTLSGKFLDVTATYTLSSTLYSASAFITDGWRVTRDFSNIFFIFILLYIAITLVLGLAHHDQKKMLMMVIIVALLINFSMFFTEVVIDTGNTLALLFYNQITVSTVNGTAAVDADTASIGANTGVKQHPVGEALAEAFEPQSFQSADFFKSLSNPATGQVDVSTMILILLGVGSMFCIAAFSFFTAAISFMGRLIQLMVSIIFAPFAFMTLIIPSMQKFDKIGWTSWSSSLLESSFLAPVYFFFILLISIMAKSPLVAQVSTSGVVDSWTTLITLLVSFVILIGLLNAATSFAKKSAGAIGSGVSNIVTSGFKAVGGLAVGTAVGVAAFGGQQTLGRLGRKVANSDTFKEAAASDTPSLKRFIARKGISSGDKVSKSSFDLGSSAAGKQMQKSLGITFKTLPGMSGISNAANQGGMVARTARKQEKDKKFGEMLGHNEDTQRAMDKGVAERETEIGNLTAAVNEMRVSAKANASLVADAEAKLADAKKNPGVLNAQGQSVSELKAQDDLKQAKLVLKSTNASIAEKQSKITDLSVGKKGDDGEILKEKDLGTRRKDGSIVTKDDLGLSYQKKLAENNKKARMNSYLHSQMKKTGYAFKEGTVKKDANGNYESAGVLNKREAARITFKDAAKRIGGSALVGAAAGSAIPIVGTAIGAGIGALDGLRRTFAAAADVKVTETAKSEYYTAKQAAAMGGDRVREGVASLKDDVMTLDRATGGHTGRVINGAGAFFAKTFSKN